MTPADRTSTRKIVAARIRQTVDVRLGEQTPPEIRELTEGDRTPAENSSNTTPRSRAARSLRAILVTKLQNIEPVSVRRLHNETAPPAEASGLHHVAAVKEPTAANTSASRLIQAPHTSMMHSGSSDTAALPGHTDYLADFAELVAQLRRQEGESIAPDAVRFWADRDDEDGQATPIPPRNWPRSWQRGSIISETLLAIIATIPAALISDTALNPPFITLVMATSALTWLACVYQSKGFEKSLLGAGAEEYRARIAAGFRLFFFLETVSFVFRLEPMRWYLVAFSPTVALLSMCLLLARREALSKRRLSGHDLSRAVVVGRIDSVKSIVRNISVDHTAGLAVIGAFVSELADRGRGGPSTEVSGVPILGPPEKVLWGVDKLRADAVVISSHPDLVGTSLRRLAWALEERGVDLYLDPGLVGVAGPRLTFRPISGQSLLRIDRGAKAVPFYLKFVFDRLIAAVLLILTAPIFLVVALAIRFDSKGPVFFWQTRIGLGGEPFRMLKFRTMLTDRQKLRRELRESLAEAAGGHRLFKMRSDPRVTRVGAFLRKYSIDELPQLVNVLRGEMSLIGPRPNLASEVGSYEWDAMRRLSIKPGMTGLWQVSGRSNLSWEESLRLDLYYVDNWSLSLDFLIIMRTFRAVLGGQGAY